LSESTSSETSEPPVVINEKRTYVLSHDPKNEKIIEIDGDTITITGTFSDNPLVDISVYPVSARVDKHIGDSEFTAEIKLNKDYLLTFSEEYAEIVFLYKNGHYDNVEFKFENGFFVPYDLSEIVEGNRNVVAKALVQPSNQVAEYIVEGGDPKEVHEVLDEIQKLSDEICAGITDDYDKLRAISRWVSANIYYDHPAFDKGIPAETLSLKYMLDKHSSVCGGYSNMTSALCAAQGIKCWNVHGSALTNGSSFAFDNGGEYHEWNFAEIDGRVIWVDSGWNSYCNLYSGGVYDDGGIGYKYFDIGEEYFAVNHKASYAEYRDYFALVQ